LSLIAPSKLLKSANAIEADYAGRLPVGLLNKLFIDAARQLC
jgi:hypothetical protein